MNLIFDEKSSLTKNVGRKYPASEYSDRVINLNRLEDRNYDNQCRLIEKERRTVINSINREMRVVESDLEDKQDLMRALFNQQRLSVLATFPYKFTGSSGSTYMDEIEKLGLLNDKNIISSSLKLPAAAAPAASSHMHSMRIKKVHSANGRLGPETASENDDAVVVRFQRPSSAVETSFQVRPVRNRWFYIYKKKGMTKKGWKMR